MKHRQTGITLIEILCCLTALSLASVGVANLYADTREEARIVQANVDTNELTQAALRSYIVNPSFATLTTQSAVSEGWVPSSLMGSSGYPTNAWGKAMELGHIDFGRPAAAMTLTQRVPAGSCPKWVASLSNGYDTIRINGEEVSSKARNLNPIQLVEPCSSGGEFASVSLILRKW